MLTRDRCLARALAAALVLGATACGSYLVRCRVESRASEYGAETTSGSLVGRGFLELSQTRGAENDAWLLWHVRVAPAGAQPRTVSLRQGTPGSLGPLLYEFPLVNPVTESGVITQVFVRTPYAGRVPFTDLWELIQRQPVSFEVVFEGDVRPLVVGPLLRTGFSDWQETCS